MKIPQELDFFSNFWGTFLYVNHVTRPKFEWHGQRRIHHLFW